ARLALETARAVSVLCEPPRQQFERYLTPEPHVFGQVDLTHSTGADQGEHLIVAEALARERRIILFRQQPRGYVHCGGGEVIAGFVARGEQRPHLAAQRLITAAGLVKEGRALGGRKLRSRVIEVADFVVALRRHFFPPCSARGRATPERSSNHGAPCRQRR